MADMLVLQGAMSGLKAAADIAIGLNKLNTMTQVNAKAIELQQIIMNVQSSALSAQSEQAAMVQEIRNLKEEIARVKAWERQKQRYKLHTPWPGASVYGLKESMSEGEPAHWICANCYEDGRRSILQFGGDKNRGSGFLCSFCKAFVHCPFLGTPSDTPYA